MAFFTLKMNESQQLRCQKYSTIIGCCLLLLPNGMFWYWGNMSVYCMSYILFVQDSSTDLDSPWIFSLHFALFTLGVLLSECISKRIGRKLTILLGVAIFDAGMLCSFFAVQNSLMALMFSMGVATGFGMGLMDGSALQLGVDWSEGSVGFFTAILQGAIPVGGPIVNQIVTLYTNPNNLYPNFYRSPTTYFTQTDVLERVPYMFLIIGCFSLCLHLIALALVRQKPSAMELVISHNVSVNVISPSASPPVQQGLDVSTSNGQGRAPSSENCKTTREKESPDYTVKEMLKTKLFYALWTTFFISGLPLLLSGNYYKAFGQIWIKDDYFITNIATVMAVSYAACSGFWGLALDVFSVKNCHIAFSSVTALMLFWYYFSAMSNRWVYFVMTLVFGCLTGPLVSCYIVSAAVLYGEAHFSTNFGVLMIAQLCFYLISPEIVGYSLTNFGWFTTFAGSGALVTMGLILTMMFVPNTKMSYRLKVI